MAQDLIMFLLVDIILFYRFLARGKHWGCVSQDKILACRTSVSRRSSAALEAMCEAQEVWGCAAGGCGHLPAGVHQLAPSLACIWCLPNPH